MSIASGTQLGHYTVRAALGAGAMGEVYRAVDTRLEREVAIKVLPEHFASDPDRLKRFEREAKTLAALNHPHVAQIFGVDQAAGVYFLVLELVPGESLEERLKRGALPLEDALDIALQVADGLEAAHEAGVIHRDLKPANIRLTPEGKIKLLDFGLAKAAHENQNSSSTDSVLSTEAGRLLGTPTYMAPEQARGKPIDKRVDIWAFGCVLYECLTAKRAFAGETLSDVLGAVLHSQADLSALPLNTPKRVHELLEACFVKDPRRRWRDIGQARLELERARTDEPSHSSTLSSTQPASASKAGWWAAGFGIVAFGLALLLWLRPSNTPPSAPPIVHAALTLPEGLALPLRDRAIALSPDGTQLAVCLYRQAQADAPQLYVRDLARGEFRALAGTEDANYPCWSPDGRAIAFFAGRELRRVDLPGGIVSVICKAPAGRGVAWGTDGKIVLAPSAAGSLWIVDEAGGAPQPITRVASEGESHRVPQMLPGGRGFLYFVMNTPQDGVYAFDTATQQSRLVLAGETEAVFVEPGYLVFGRDGNLVLQPFELAALALSGSAKALAPGVSWDAKRASLGMAISASGTLVYLPITRARQSSLAWLSREGVESALAVEPLALIAASLTPNGRRAAVNVEGDRGESLLAVLDLERGIRAAVGNPIYKYYYGVVAASDGQRFYTTDSNTGQQRIVSYPLGGGAAEPLFECEPEYEYAISSIAPDGHTLLYSKVPLRDKIGDIYTIDLEGDRTPRQWLATTEAEWFPKVSPAGDVLACFVSGEDELGSLVKVTTYPTPSALVQVSPTLMDGTFGWLNSTELYWVDLNRRLWSASVHQAAGQLEIGEPRALMQGQALREGLRILAYDLARERFLVALEQSPREPAQLVVRSDWRPEILGSKLAK